MSLTEHHVQTSAAELTRRVRGTVALPGSAGYDRLRAAFNLTVDQHPAVVVAADGADDVAEAVRFARAHGLRVAVQATGHGVGRPADGALLIVTSRMNRVAVDPVARTARIEAGATWAPVLETAQAHGLAPLLGSSPTVGAVGYTLGGGMGWLARRHGLSSDLVRAFELVTPDGIEVRTSADQQPELFWALKGGGAGALGVVTAMEIELVPLTTVYGGNLLYPAEMAGEVLTRWRDWIRTVPDELTSAVTLMNYPPLDAVPEPLRGRSFVQLRGVWCGDLREGQVLLDQWREWQAPVMDLFGPMPFTEIATVSNDPVDPIPAMVTTEWFDHLVDEAIDVVVRAAFPPDTPPVLVFAELRHAGGAMARRASEAANDRGRSGEVLLEMVGAVATPETAPALDSHLRATRLALAPYVTGATYLNFTEGREKQERTATAFSRGHLERVAAVKAAVDADDRFSHGIVVSVG